MIGGGLAGLTAAIASARGGARTVLLEAHALGGRAKSADREGMLLNEGPHALYVHGAGRGILKELGIDVPGAAPLLPLYFRRGDRLHLAPVSPRTALARSLVKGRSRVDFVRALAAVRRDDVERLHDVSVADWLDRRVKDATVRSMIESLVRVATYANDPGGLSAATALIQLRLAIKGVRYLHGGWRALVRALHDAAWDAGVCIRIGSAVTGLRPGTGGWEIATGSGAASGPEPGVAEESFSADATRKTAPLLTASSIVLATGGPGPVRRLLGLEAGSFSSAGAPVTVSSLDLITDTMPRHTVLMGLDEPLYLSVHNPPANLCDDGRVLVTAACYHSPTEDRSADAMRAYLRDHFDVANDGRARVLDERYLHRLVVSHGRPEAKHGGTTGRPGITVPGVSGAFVAGDWIGPEGLLADAALYSGREAGRAAAAAARAANRNDGTTTQAQTAAARRR